MDDTTTTTAVTDASTAATPPEPRNPLAEVEGVIERWWDEHFPGSPVAQVTQAWNHALAAKEELKRRLKNLIDAA